MRRTRIKICGVTNVDDAVMAAELGADAIGMVFHPASARCVEIDAAAEIAARVPAFVACVGLFVDARTESIAKVLTEVSLQGLQLHGDEKPADARDLLACRKPLMKAIRVTSEAQTFAALEQWKNDDAPPLAGVVLETGGTNTPGGTGVANNFSLIAKMNAAGAFNELGSLIVAGGLKPEMVGEVVRTIRPYAVDVSSGVEKVKGKKDRRLIEVFIASVREADAS